MSRVCVRAYAIVYTLIGISYKKASRKKDEGTIMQKY
jgi:hypothetical protein